MSGEEILAELEELARNLSEREIITNLFIVGGAVMVLSHNARAGTEGVDADFNNAREVLDAAEEVAIKMGLSEKWINTDSRVFFPPGKDPEWEVLCVLDVLTVHVAGSRTMLAMKLKAGRSIRDGGDIRFLLEVCGITSEKDALAVFCEFYPDEVLAPRSRAVLQASLHANLNESRPDVSVLA